MGFDFVDETTGWAHGWEPDSGKAIIMKSVDGGISWSLEHEAMELSISSIFAIDRNVAYVSGYQGVLLKTVDGGRNWQSIAPYSENINYNSVWFLNANQGVVTGSRYDGDIYRAIILQTNDGGRTWRERIESRYADITTIQFVNDSTVFFITYNDSGQYVFCRSEDTLCGND